MRLLRVVSWMMRSGFPQAGHALVEMIPGTDSNGCCGFGVMRS
jgi:hypothetical protein